MPPTRLASLLFLLGLWSSASPNPEPILLWPQGAPGSEGRTGAEVVRITELGEQIVSSVHRPSITPYLPPPAIATGVAVIVIPGGGHRELWMDHEGYRVGQWLSDHGVAAFVLKYRLAREPGSTYKVEGEALADVQRAIRLVRSRAAEWHLAPDRIGVLGFSAGGELAALAGTKPDEGIGPGNDAVSRQSSRVGFMGLIYASPPADFTLSQATPPAFLLAGEDDSPAITQGASTLFTAIRNAGGTVELHVLTGAGHGFGIRAGNPPAIANWPALFVLWLDGLHLLTPPSAAGEISPQMAGGIPHARPVPVYSAAARALAAQQALGLAAPPVLGTATPLTPNAPYAPGGAHLSFWKPAFVLGTAGGGEAGVNFWGIHNEGHINVGFTATGATALLDCRLLSVGPITWKIYDGPRENLRAQGKLTLRDNHFLLIVPSSTPGNPVSVELWPTPVTEPMGLLGCDLSLVEGNGPAGTPAGP